MQNKNTTVITFQNPQPKSGKTTLTVNIAVTMSQVFGKKILVIDATPEMEASEFFGKATYKHLMNFYDCFKNNKNIKDYINSTQYSNIDIVYGSPAIDRINTKLLPGMYLKEMKLESISAELIDEGIYDYIFWDCNSNLDLFNAIVLDIFNNVIIPISPQKYALEDIKTIIKTTAEVKNTSPELSILGIVYVDWQLINRPSYTKKESILNAYPNITFQNSILCDDQLQTANSNYQSVYDIDPKAASQDSFTKLCREIIEKTGKEI